MNTTQENGYYRDIHKIALSLEKIEKHLKTIAKSYEPITYDIGMTLAEKRPDADFNHEDDGK